MKQLFVTAWIAFAISACTNQQVYNSMEGARENECRQIADTNERDLCFENARKPYERYERQRKESSSN